MTLYNVTLRSALNEPAKTKIIKILQSSPWFDSEYENLRRLRRKAEKHFKNTLEVHKENYVRLRKQCTDLAHKKKCKFYGDKLDGAGTKMLYSEINRSFDKKQEVVFPDLTSDGELANSFMNYFSLKIEKIRTTFPNKVHTSSATTSTATNLLLFDPATYDEIKQIVSSYGVKSSSDDPIPVNLLNKHIDTFIPIWTELVKLSLSEGSMECLKNAVILPPIKQMDEQIDKDNLKNYRPVSNLLFVGKLIKRVVSTRLNKYMTENNLHSDFQYGYKKGNASSEGSE